MSFHVCVRVFCILNTSVFPMIARDFILEQTVSCKKQCAVFCKKCVAELQTKCKAENVSVLLMPLFKAWL